MDKIVIIMPAYNEAENVGLMIEELFGKEFPQIKNADMHLLVVDDFSPDGTGEIVKKYQSKYPNLHLLQKQKEGLGWAYIRGMQYAVDKLGADAVMEMDADFQHPPRFVKDMVAAFLNGADYVIGSRYIKGGSIPKEWEFSRKAVSFLGNLFIRLVLLKPQIHDLTTGFRLTRVKGVLDQIDLEHLMEPTRFAYKVDLLYQSIKNAKQVVEVPLEFASRTKEKSKFNPKEMVSTFKVAIILGIKDKQKIIKFGTVGFAGYVVNATALYLFTKLNWPGWAAWGLSTELAILNNFTWNNIWTFKDQQINGLTMILSKFLQFNITSAGGLLIQVVVGVATDYLTGSQYRQIVLPLTIAFLVMPYNYLMYTLVIWRKKASSRK
ncbi:MAG: Glycosyl transferase family 2 [Candidatus Amesbacteria bacterium GW2011_GWB1_47_26]|uniref:Glycosyl transferase family 2 n=1 Tax=Candidatus Amesbacteria bacterium GW2011_GWC2_45_19 TaxID=1618366 RepID=A0A0G1M5Q2_9BACT|nr:MAG: Glycosyl transferase family 2 [Candidatus Amesbacteria bacterium GW2011_GWC2_45_19]KKU38261.1 MAG: Glycosyl transferase family 2 [Candidatus Amesbacteria bacterium GW2011_GWA1_46_35]KKU69550.1 MAG: Glycosyl transferase family 2 [Microgenomates group bacterium GW2011_GWC1_47_20]KKU74049.1 MAG: Glycosyl transferase family 2 [Candidatus Amesbacteria bacterium GW2011_GWB1_47_26]KKU79660.1 MAG: Glycosyl transferase family 2 [Candidatus Amesbacteria bacterium GW2011_GWA2_47_70]